LHRDKVEANLTVKHGKFDALVLARRPMA